MTDLIDKNLADVSIVVAGSVDSGKSSTIGVLINGKLDDGNGSAREGVAKHPHEIESGKTSDISTRTLKTDKGKLITMIDLCGHEKYLKTTTYGITGYYPDYAIVIIAANRGILKMTKEHLCILLYLNIPIILVVTRIDIAPPDIYQNTMKTIQQIGKKFHKKIENINSSDELSLTSEELIKAETNARMKIDGLVDILHQNDDVIPVIVTSNKTGYYFDTFKYMISSLKPRKLWPDTLNNGSIFYIDSTFNPPGIGLVVSGILRGKPVKTGDILLLGPKDKDFIPVRVRGIHNNNRELVQELSNHARGCFAISAVDKKHELTRKTISKGVVLVSDKALTKNICYHFNAKIEILNHSTTISKNYSPVIHCGTIRQTARLITINNIDKTNRKYKDQEDDKDTESNTLRTGDVANVTFKFKQYPEFIENNAILFFREGTTRGTGTIDSLLSVTDDPNAVPDQLNRKKKFYKKKRNNNVQIKVIQ
jgi:elongation factor 1-alpha